MHTCTATCSSNVLMGPTSSCFNSVDDSNNFNKGRTGRSWNQGRLTKRQHLRQPSHHRHHPGRQRRCRENVATSRRSTTQAAVSSRVLCQSGDTADNLWQANNSESADARPKLARRWHLQSQSSASKRSIFRRTTWQTCQVQLGARETSSQQQWTRLSR